MFSLTFKPHPFRLWLIKPSVEFLIGLIDSLFLGVCKKHGKICGFTKNFLLIFFTNSFEKCFEMKFRRL